MRIISLFTGIGGLDFGFEAAGFETAVAVELDPTACRNAKMNRPEWSIIEGDIHDVSSAAILEAGGLLPGEADVLIGGPPCQPFSKSGYWARGEGLRLDDPRADTLTAYLRVLRDTRPKAFLLENVYGLMYKGKDEGLHYLLDGIEQINRETGTNYSIQYRKLNAVDYGAPQLRERVFLVGAQDGRAFKFPEPTHANPANRTLPDNREPWRTAWDAIGDLPAHPNENGLSVGGKWANLLPSIPEGENYLHHTRKGSGQSLFGWRTRYWSFLLKLAKRRPSWTIQAQPGSAIGPFHWTSRKLSSRELCRLQTFPNDVSFDCGRTEVQRMMGNAVPSLMAEVLARSIRAQLFDNPSDEKLRLLPPVRRPVADLEPVMSVPAEYLHLEGNHSDHPGTRRKTNSPRQKTKHAAE